MFFALLRLRFFSALQGLQEFVPGVLTGLPVLLSPFGATLVVNSSDRLILLKGFTRLSHVHSQRLQFIKGTFPGANIGSTLFQLCAGLRHR